MRYDYSNISRDGQRWIRDLMQYQEETRFPDIDPGAMTENDREILVAYLQNSDGSMKDQHEEFSCRVADEIEALQPVEADSGREVTDQPVPGVKPYRKRDVG